jgi:Ni,Fe-hydrogenase III large subunit/Ni,Fe-hydrogenase III component G
MDPFILPGMLKSFSRPPVELPRPAANEIHYLIENKDDFEANKTCFLNLIEWLRKEQNYYLCTLVAVDERLEEDQVFKLYYVFSHPVQDELGILEFPLNHPQHTRDYPSIRTFYPSVIPLEREIYDLFGLTPLDESFEPDDPYLLHSSYPVGLFPMRRTRPIKRLNGLLCEINPPRPPRQEELLPEGVLVMPVGPIHAGIIEPGHFPFQIAGEVIEELTPRLGYTHRGIEKMFEVRFTLENGWQLAEKVSGDSSFAHSMAYCQAVESLARISIPKPAQVWRAIFLELERIYNHINDTSAIIHDMAYEQKSVPISTLREACMQFNQRLTGHRLLRGVNRPGGIVLPGAPNLADIRLTLSAIQAHFLPQVRDVLDEPACRDRMLSTGILTKEEARDATGLVRRASGWVGHDFRLLHPQGAYTGNRLQDALNATILNQEEEVSQNQAPVFLYQLNGDVFARLAMRLAEVETSVRIIDILLDEIKAFGNPGSLQVAEVGQALRKIPDSEFGLGYVEGWRGDIFYWVTKGPNNTIARVKVRDPSIFNWAVFPKAVIRKEDPNNAAAHKKDPNYTDQYFENILADFPLINKSFNLSYAGQDG